MPALRCCAVLSLEPQRDPRERVRTTSRIASRVEAWGDPRVVILQRYEDLAEWYSTDDIGLSKFWAMVEALVAEHRFCGGENWNESVIRKFRQENPQITLLGY